MRRRASKPPRRPTDGRAGASGVTLIELMVVVAIVVGLLGAGMYSMGLISQADMKNEVRRLTSAIKYTWSRAAMNNAQYRMVFDLDENSYHTEVTDAPVVEESNTSEEGSSEFVSEEARRAQEAEQEAATGTAGEQGDEPFELNKKPTFKKVKSSELEPHPLPGDFRFVRIIPCNKEEPIEEGRAAIHFYPNGFQQPAIIVMQNGEKGRTFSLMTEPLTGRVRVFGKEIEKTESCGEPEEIQEEW